jgi:CRISPR type IV-associated protein Csf3
MPKAKHQPIRIDFEVNDLMVVPDRHPPLLDSILLALTGQRFELPFAASALPLATASNPSWPEGVFVWMASALEIQWQGPSSDRFLTRNARPLEMLEDAAGHGATTVHFNSGVTKASRTRIALRHASTACAWCLGDVEALQGLLSRLQALGSHRHGGHGLVRSVSVVVDKIANEKCWNRPLPGWHPKDPWKDGRYLAAGRSTPPYWDRDLGQQAWWPGLPN